MKSKKFTSRPKGVVSLYINLRLWHKFDEACRQRYTTRGAQVLRLIEETMQQWAQEKP